MTPKYSVSETGPRISQFLRRTIDTAGFELEFVIEPGDHSNPDFENPDTAQVSIGTVVTIRDEAGHEETYSILGAWDSAPEIGVVSYKAGIGQSLLGKKPGESVALPTETGTRSVTVGTIETFKNLELLRTKVHVLQNPQEEATTN